MNAADVTKALQDEIARLTTEVNRLLLANRAMNQELADLRADNANFKHRFANPSESPSLDGERAFKNPERLT